MQYWATCSHSFPQTASVRMSITQVFICCQGREGLLLRGFQCYKKFIHALFLSSRAKKLPIVGNVLVSEVVPQTLQLQWHESLPVCWPDQFSSASYGSASYQRYHGNHMIVYHNKTFTAVTLTECTLYIANIIYM